MITPGEIRTPDLMVRSHALYPAELRAQNWTFVNYSPLEDLLPSPQELLYCRPPARL